MLERVLAMEMEKESHWLETWWPLFVIIFALLFTWFFLAFPQAGW